MQRLQVFLLLLICSMFMVLLQNGFNQTWEWSKIGLGLSGKTNKIEVETENNLLRIKNLLNNRSSNFRIYINTENYDVLKSMEYEASFNQLHRKGNFSHQSRIESMDKLTSIEMIAKMMSIREKRNSSRWGYSKRRRSGFLRSFDPLKGFPVIDETKTPIRYVLLITHFRAGSSFVGDLLQQNWKTFYTFEPLHLFQINSKIGSENETEALQLLNNIYSCRFKAESNYVKWASLNNNKFLFNWNRFLWSLCNIRRTTCFDPQFISDICLRSKYRVIKVTRLSLESAEKLLANLDKSIDLKLVYLVRDPRAMYNSRMKLDWCKSAPCGDVSVMCDNYESDLKAYRRLVKTYGKRVIAIRHEDLSLDPFGKSRRLFEALDIPFTSGARRFLRINTEAKMPVDNPYSIRRRSKQVISKWTKDMNDTEVYSIQDKCPNVFNELGYKPIIFGDKNTSFIAFEDILEPRLPLPNSL